MNIFDEIRQSIKAEKQLLEKLENGETIKLPKDLKPLVDSCCRRASKPLTGQVIYF